MGSGLTGTGLHLAAGIVIAGVAPTATGFGFSFSRGGLGEYAIKLDNDDSDQDEMLFLGFILGDDSTPDHVIVGNFSNPGEYEVFTTDGVGNPVDIRFNFIISRIPNDDMAFTS